MTVCVDTLLYEKLERLRGLRCVVTILGMCKRLHLVPHVLLISEATEMPPSILYNWELPAMVPKVIRSLALEELTIRDDRADPRLTRKQIVQGVLKHPHVDRINDMRQLFKRNPAHIGNLIHVTNHDYGVTARVLKTSHDALSLVLFATPGILLLWSLVSSYHDMHDFWEPLCESLSVVLEKQFLWTANVIDFRLDKNKSINITIEKLKAELENIELVVEHEPIYEHL